MVAFNTAEGWSCDVSEDMANEIAQICASDDGDIPAELGDFVERHGSGRPEQFAAALASERLEMNEEDEEWRAAEEALERARKLPGGPERIEALRHAGKLRFAADRKRYRKEQGAGGYPSKYVQLIKS